jgi:hypothetical protein
LQVSSMCGGGNGALDTVLRPLEAGPLDDDGDEDRRDAALRTLPSRHALSV